MCVCVCVCVFVYVSVCVCVYVALESFAIYFCDVLTSYLSAHLEMEALHTSNKDILNDKIDGI